MNENGYVEKGTVLMEAEPFVYVLDQNYQLSRCDHCLGNEKELHKCLGCQFVYYCNKQCQKKAWKLHKFECKNIKKCHPLVLPSTARLIGRILIKYKIGEGEEEGYISPNHSRTFKHLMSHSEEIKKNSKQMEHIESLYGVLKKFLGNDIAIPDFNQFSEIYGRVITNAFHIYHTMDDVATGIYLGPSILNHSCSPNAHIHFIGTKLIVRSLTDITNYDILQIRISYVDLLQSTKERRKELENIYNFICDCTKCIQPDLKSDALACSNVKCKNVCNLGDNKCSLCGNKLSNEHIQKFKTVKEFTISKMTEIKQNNDINLIEKCLEMQKNVLHFLNIIRLKTLELAVEISLKRELWQKVLLYAFELAPGYVEYYSKYHIKTIDLFLTIAEMHVNCDQFSDALNTLLDIKSVLIITLGKDHPYMKSFQMLMMEITSYS